MDTSTILQCLAMEYVGKPYIWGGDDPTGFDCSGLVIELLQSIGLLPPGFDANAEGLRQRWATAIGAPVFGDLVFYGPKGGRATHVGFALNAKLMLEAGGGDSTTTTLAAAQAANAFVRVRPIARRPDLLDVRRPAYPA